jgi:hypothetical protein
MPRKSAAAAPPPPRADDVANDPDLADFLKQLVNVDDAGGGSLSSSARRREPRRGVERPGQP